MPLSFGEAAFLFWPFVFQLSFVARFSAKIIGHHQRVHWPFISRIVPSSPRNQNVPQPRSLPMRDFVRPVTAALSIACLAAALVSVSTGSALAQAKMAPAPAPQAMAQPEPVKQMALTDKQVEGVIAAAKDMDAITEKMPDNAKPDAKITAQLEGVAKKYGFASYDEYNGVVDH